MVKTKEKDCCLRNSRSSKPTKEVGNKHQNFTMKKEEAQPGITCPLCNQPLKNQTTINTKTGRRWNTYYCQQCNFSKKIRTKSPAIAGIPEGHPVYDIIAGIIRKERAIR